MSYKLHVIMISAVILFGVLALFVSGEIRFGASEDENAAQPVSGFIQISRATWGKNCNYFIEQIRAGIDATPEEKQNLPQVISNNNVLRTLSLNCNNRKSCSFKVDEKALGPDPVRRCTKLLELEYRCNPLEVPRSVQAYDTEQVALDCR